MLNKLRNPRPCLILQSDASSVGQDTFMNDKETGGNWNNREQENFVNVNEMFAVKFSLIFFASDHKKINVQINIGNTTMVSILKNLGIFHNKNLNKISRSMQECGIVHKIQIYPNYVNNHFILVEKPSLKLYIKSECIL